MNMKKIALLTVMTGALMMSGCSSDEIVGLQQDSPISFRTVLSRQTRATSSTSSTLNTFNVTAWKEGDNRSQDVAFIDQVDYEKGQDGNYTSVTKYYWPKGSTLEFYAYAPKASNVNGIVRNSELSYTVTPLADTDNQIDLLFAKNSGNKTANALSGVTLNFRHAMSQIQIKVKNTEPSLKFIITGWKIAGVDGSATFAFDDNIENTSLAASGSQNTLNRNMWSGNDTYTANFSKEVTKTLNGASAAVALDGSAILIPQAAPKATGYSGTDPTNNPLKGAYIAIEYGAVNAATGDEIVSAGTMGCWPVDFDWFPGYRYCYTVDMAEFGYKENGKDDPEPVMDGAEIKFVQISVDTWLPQNDNDANVDVTMQ